MACQLLSNSLRGKLLSTVDLTPSGGDRWTEKEIGRGVYVTGDSGNKSTAMVKIRIRWRNQPDTETVRGAIQALLITIWSLMMGIGMPSTHGSINLRSIDTMRQVQAPIVIRSRPADRQVHAVGMPRILRRRDTRAQSCGQQNQHDSYEFSVSVHGIRTFQSNCQALVY